MTARAVLVTLGGAALLGVGVPWLFMRALVPSLLGLPNSTVSNYRGRPVSAGLGIVWLVWSGCAIVGGVASGSVLSATLLEVLTLAGPLALVAFAMGLVDDAYGSSDAKGFKGHLKAMARGRLTTGGLKLVGIGLASLVVALIVREIAPWGVSEVLGSDPWSWLRIGGSILLAGAAIALTSNFLNLMDLRPGRALKAYSVLATAAAVSTAFLLYALPPDSGLTTPERILGFFGLLIFLLGPAVAVWRFDLGEVAMLGDAGANPMGAVAGMLIVLGLPTWGLIVYTALMFGLNLASERFSFSKVIEATPVLRWLDGLGRLPADEAAGVHPVAGGPDATSQESHETHPHDGGLHQ